MKLLVVSVLLALFATLMYGVNIGLACFVGGVVTVVLEGAVMRFDPREVLASQIDYGLLVRKQGRNLACWYV